MLLRSAVVRGDSWRNTGSRWEAAVARQLGTGVLREGEMVIFAGVDGSVEVAAPAKLNLYLRVVGKRPDGFHDIETVMVKIGLADHLRFEPRDDATLSLAVEQAYPAALGRTAIPTTADNLVLKAAALLQRVTGIRHGVHIRLLKRIPAEAGLGGGSSDAGVTLKALNALWKTGLSEKDLLSLAAELGSDVPFFAADHACALCTGRGELLEPLHVSACLSVVLAKPRVGLSTAAVYRGCIPEPQIPSSQELINGLRAGEGNRVAHSLHNGLQSVAERLSPGIGALKDWFAQQECWGHQLTGSGSAYFAICPSIRHAQRMAARLRERGLPWVTVVRTSA